MIRRTAWPTTSPTPDDHPVPGQGCAARRHAAAGDRAARARAPPPAAGGAPSRCSSPTPCCRQASASPGEPTDEPSDSAAAARAADVAHQPAATERSHAAPRGQRRDGVRRSGDRPTEHEQAGPVARSACPADRRAAPLRPGPDGGRCAAASSSCPTTAAASTSSSDQPPTDEQPDPVGAVRAEDRALPRPRRLPGCGSPAASRPRRPGRAVRRRGAPHPSLRFSATRSTPPRRRPTSTARWCSHLPAPASAVVRRWRRRAADVAGRQPSRPAGTGPWARRLPRWPRHPELTGPSHTRQLSGAPSRTSSTCPMTSVACTSPSTTTSGPSPHGARSGADGRRGRPGPPVRRLALADPDRIGRTATTSPVHEGDAERPGTNGSTSADQSRSTDASASPAEAGDRRRNGVARRPGDRQVRITPIDPAR